MAATNTPSILVSSTGLTYRLLPGGETVIGSVGCAVMLREPGVLPRHARIIVDQGFYYIEDLGGGILLNGQRVVSRIALRDGDSLRIAVAELVFHAGSMPVVASPGHVQVIPTQHQSSPIQATSPGTPHRIQPHPITKRPTQPPQPAPPTNTAPQQRMPLQPMVQRTPITPIQQPSAAQPLFPPLGQQGLQVPAPQGGNPQILTSIAIPSQCAGYGQPQLQGNVVHVDGPHMEEPDFNAGIFLLKITLWTFLFPVLIWKPGLISLLLMGRKDNKVSTRYVRVRDSVAQETVVRMKGDIVHGTVGMGDLVSFWGRWDSGTLQMQVAFNHKLNTLVRVR